MEWLLLATRFDTTCHSISNFLLENVWFGVFNVQVHSISLMRRIWGHRFATNTPQAREFSKRSNCKNSRKRETAVKSVNNALDFKTTRSLGSVNFQWRTAIAQDPWSDFKSTKSDGVFLSAPDGLSTTNLS